jgi:hypothetical protein
MYWSNVCMFPGGSSPNAVKKFRVFVILGGIILYLLQLKVQLLSCHQMAKRNAKLEKY